MTMQRAAATGTGLVVDVHDDLDPRQMRRQRAAIALRRFGARRVGARHPVPAMARPPVDAPRPARPVCSATDCSRSSIPLLQRRVVELFRAAAKPVAVQAGDQQLQPLDLGQSRAQDQL